MSLVSKVIKDRICYVKMENSQHFNCLSDQMCQELMEDLSFAYEQECVGIEAEDALNVGLINRVADKEELEAVLEEHFLQPLRRNSVLSISAIKRQFRILSRASTVISAESFERINDYRHKVYGGEDYKEGIRSFLEKRPPQYKGKASDLD